MAANGQMPAIRALALAAMALGDVARRTPDVPDWYQAAQVVKQMLDKERARTMNLTNREYQLLTFIKTYTNTTGYPPTYREVQRHFNWASTHTVTHYLKRLKAKRRVTWQRGVPRSLRVLERAA